ncbi:hypothetical protein Tco_0509929, partial [Tanacetum coccineum]
MLIRIWLVLPSLRSRKGLDDSLLEESEGYDDSFYELATLDPSEVKRWYVPRWNITNDSLLDDSFSCRTL